MLNYRISNLILEKDLFKICNDIIFQNQKSINSNIISVFLLALFRAGKIRTQNIKTVLVI